MSYVQVVGKPVYLVVGSRFTRGKIHQVNWLQKTIFCKQDGFDSAIQFTESPGGHLKDVLEVRSKGEFKSLYATEVTTGEIHFGMGTLDVEPESLRVESLHRRTPFFDLVTVDNVKQSSWADVLALSGFHFLEIERDIETVLSLVFPRPYRGINASDIGLLDNIIRSYREGMPKSEILDRMRGDVNSASESEKKLIEAVKHLSR